MNLAASWPLPKNTLPEIYPAQMAQILLDSYAEVLGAKELQGVLTQAGLAEVTTERGNPPADYPFEAPARIALAVEQAYGAQTGHGICLRSGRAMFRRGVREFSSILGLTDRGFRLMPPAQKIVRGLDLLSWLLNHYSDQRTRVEKTRSYLLLVNERCPHCWGPTHPTAGCALPVGALQEGAAWASGGKRYAVEETACRARGDPACIFQIARTPL